MLLEGDKVPRGRYDVIFAELQASESQLGYLQSLVEAQDPPVIVIPGPPAILSRELTDAKLRAVKCILAGARGIWAYAPELKTFCEDCSAATAPSSSRGRTTWKPHASWPVSAAAPSERPQDSGAGADELPRQSCRTIPSC